MQDMSNWVPRSLYEAEKDHIQCTLNYCRGNKTAAANLLGINVKTVDYKIKEYEEKRAEDEHRRIQRQEAEQDFLRRSRGLPSAHGIASGSGITQQQAFGLATVSIETAAPAMQVTNFASPKKSRGPKNDG